MKKNSNPKIVEVFNVASDSGKYNTKVVAINENEEYVTNVFRTTVSKEDKADGKFVVMYEGNRYVVGEETEMISENQTGMDKANSIHKISVLTGVCDLMDKCGYDGAETVVLTVNMPLSKYIDTKERERMQRLYETPDHVSMTVNGKLYEFDLEVELYFEGYGSSLMHEELLGTEPFIVLMLGSENISAVAFDEEGKPMRTQAKCIDGGCVKIIEEVQHELLPVVGKTVSDTVIKSIIKKNKKRIDKEVLDIAGDVCEKQLKGIKNRLEKLGIEFDLFDVVAVGGGALLLKEYIQNVFGEDTIIDEDPMFSDCKGSLMLLEE